MTPTPVEPCDRLSAAWGGPRIWVKRDDLTGFGLSGNKIRKLEFHLAAARNSGADVVVTMGAAQSNHCRTTALACARLGLRTVLLLRTTDGNAPATVTGNHLLSSMSGAEISYITPDEWRDLVPLVDDVVARLRREGASPWVIPVGASDEIGMWGFVLAMGELADQTSQMGTHTGRATTVWHAASSGGTTAGLAWAAHRMGSDTHIVGCSVDETATDLLASVDRIWSGANAVYGGATPTPHLSITDDHVGRGYGLTTDEELATQTEATALTGLIFDPTYSGKALHGLKLEIEAGRFSPDDNVVFWHTGGGFAAFAHRYPQVGGTVA